MKKSKTLFFSIAAIAGAGFFILAFRKVGLVSLAQILNNFDYWQLAIVLVLTLFIMLLWVLRWFTIIQFFKLKINFRTVMSARLAGLAVSTITPAMGFGGEPAQYLLAKNEKTPKETLIASIFIDKLLFGTVNFVIVISGVILLLIGFSIPLAWRLFLIYLLVLVSVWGGVFYFRAFRGEKLISYFFKSRTKGVEKELHKFFNFKNPHFWKALGFSLVRGIVYLARFYFIILFLGDILSIKETFLVTGVLLLAGMIPIPMALGSLELSQAFAFSAIGLASGLGLSMVLVMRVFDLGLVFWGFLVIFRQSFKGLGIFNGKLG